MVRNHVLMNVLNLFFLNKIIQITIIFIYILTGFSDKPPGIVILPASLKGRNRIFENIVHVQYR